MSAAVQAPLRLDGEVASYWESLAEECKRQTNSINAVVSEYQLPQGQAVAFRQERNTILMACESHPSTEIKLSLAREHWGTKISASVRGYEEEDLRFYPEEFEFALGSDPDQGTVAISSEGRSLCPVEFASFVAQHFRRSFPGLSLPCTGC
jgi:hypothetical protein